MLSKKRHNYQTFALLLMIPVAILKGTTFLLKKQLSKRNILSKGFSIELRKPSIEFIGSRQKKQTIESIKIKNIPEHKAHSNKIEDSRATKLSWNLPLTNHEIECINVYLNAIIIFVFRLEEYLQKPMTLEFKIFHFDTVMCLISVFFD